MPNRNLARLFWDLNSVYINEYLDRIAENSGHDGPMESLFEEDIPEFHEAMKNVKEALKRSLFLLPLLFGYNLN